MEEPSQPRNENSSSSFFAVFSMSRVPALDRDDF